MTPLKCHNITHWIVPKLQLSRTPFLRSSTSGTSSLLDFYVTQQPLESKMIQIITNIIEEEFHIINNCWTFFIVVLCTFYGLRDAISILIMNTLLVGFFTSLGPLLLRSTWPLHDINIHRSTREASLQANINTSMSSVTLVNTIQRFTILQDFHGVVETFNSLCSVQCFFFPNNFFP